MDHDDDNPIRSILNDLTLDHLHVLAQRRSTNAKAEDLGGLAIFGQIGFEFLGKTIRMGDLKGLDITVANDCNSRKPIAAFAHIVTNTAIPTLLINFVWRLDVVANAIDTRLTARIPNDVVNIFEVRHITGEPHIPK